MDCQITRSSTARLITLSGMEQELARLTVHTHSASPADDAHGLSVGGRLIVGTLTEAVRLFDKLPGQRVREPLTVEDCDDADHSPDALATMEANAEADERDGSRY